MKWCGTLGVPLEAPSVSANFCGLIKGVIKSLLMKVNKNEKASLKLNIQKTKKMASGPITS